MARGMVTRLVDCLFAQYGLSSWYAVGLALRGAMVRTVGFAIGPFSGMFRMW